MRASTDSGSTWGAPGFFRPFMPGPAAPNPPASATASIGSQPNSILVSWTAPSSLPVATIFWYVIVSSSSNGGDPVIRLSAAGTDTSITVPNVNRSSYYTFAVYAVNCPGYSLPTVTNSIILNTIYLNLLGTVYNPSNSNAWNDSTAFEHSASLAEGTATWNSNHNGLVLNGSTYWTAPNLGTFPNYTVNVWYKDNGTTDFNDTCIITEEFAGSVIQYVIRTGEGTTPGLYAGGFYNGGFYNGTPFSLTPGIWQNICFTWDGTNIITYIDGSNIGSSNYSGAVALSSGNPIRIGRRWDNADYMTGTIGAAQIYNYALTSNAVGSNYSNDVPTYYEIHNFHMNTLIVSNTNLSSAWTLSPSFANQHGTVQFYETNSSNIPTSNLTTFGSSYSFSNGQTSRTGPSGMTRGNYYFAGMTVTGAVYPEFYTPSAVIFPSPAQPVGSMLYTDTSTNADYYIPSTPQYLTMSPGLSFGTSAFTIEFWYNPVAGYEWSNGWPDIDGEGILGSPAPYGPGNGGSNTPVVFFYHDSGLIFQNNSNAANIGYALHTNLVPGTWSYFAITGSNDGSNFYLGVWQDGFKLGNNIEPIADWSFAHATTQLGYWGNNNTYPLSGYLSDMRVVVGTALYDPQSPGTIPVPTESLSNIAGTQILLWQSNSGDFLVDNAGVQTLSNVGEISWDSSTPFY